MLFINKIRFFKNIFSENFVEALSNKELNNLDRGFCGGYACYRMGMYLTVSNSTSSRFGWMARFSSIASLAACGRGEEATELLRQTSRWLKPAVYWRELAISLAPYMPQLALEALGNSKAPPDIHLALWLRAGRQAEALRFLDNLSLHGLKGSRELPLFICNARGGCASERLSYLNDFLGRFGLSELELRDNGTALSAANLMGIDTPSSVEGPLVTVLMTAFRVGERISYALDSVMAQTYRNIEIIVVDDACDQDSAAVIQRYAERDGRVRYCRLPLNLGTYGAKTVGLMMAKGEFVTCHDADDWMHPQRIELQVAPLLANEKIIFTTSQWLRVQDDGVYYARPVYPLMRINPASPMFRRERVLREAGAWDLVRTGADSEFFARLRLVFGRDAMVAVKKPLTIGAHRAGSLTTDSVTGYGADDISLQRIEYWESWVRWHIKVLQRGDRPRLPCQTLPNRSFEAPENLVVDSSRLRRCFDQLGLKALL